MNMDDPVSAVGLKLVGRRVVFAGAGDVAYRKLSRLLDSGAELVVIAPACLPEIEELAAKGRLSVERRKAQGSDFAGALLAFIATDDDQANAELAAAARQHGALVNRSDKPGDCDFVLPALAWMNTVHIGVFSDSPALSRWVRKHLEQTLGPEFPEFAAAFGEIRERVRRHGLPQATRSEILSRLLNEGLYNVYKSSGMKAAIARTDALVETYRSKGVSEKS